MKRLRRTNRSAIQLPVAAEVLEARSLLSAGLAAVQGAEHHARDAVQQALIVAHAKQTLPVTAEITTVTPTPGLTKAFPAQLSISALKPTVGGPFSAQLKIIQNIPGAVVTITATISGKVQSIQRGLDGSKTLDLTPGRNNFVEKLKDSTGTHVVQSARTDGELMELKLDALGNFQSVELVELVTKSSPAETFDLFCSV